MPVRFRRAQAPTSPVLLEVPTSRHLNLLAHAQMEELDIGSQCGGHGVCGADRIQVRVTKGNISPLTAIERTHLSDEKIAEGWRLGCQCYPESDDAEIDVLIPR